MTMQHAIYTAGLLELVSKANEAVKAIPPLFALDASVAVNPFLGQSGEPLAVTAARLARVGGVRIGPDRAAIATKLADGHITEDDLRAALDVVRGFDRPTLDEVMAALDAPATAPHALPTVAELAAQVSGRDWPGLIEERIGAWAGAWFDRGQALWQPARRGGAWLAWRDHASRDLTPEIHGLTGFGAFVSQTSRSPWRALGRSSETLGLSSEAAGTAFHRLLMDLGGWAQYARGLGWHADLAGENDNTAAELLAIRLVWEEALFTLYREEISELWAETVAAHAQPVTPGREQVIDAILQEAAERAEQRMLAETLETGTPRNSSERPRAQAAFCIDVRSEPFRRALEAQDNGIETLGFAGFFGLATAHCAAGSDVIEARGPVLIPTGVSTRADESETADRDRRYAARAKRAWGRFKGAAVSSFAFVEAAGPAYAGTLLRDTLGMRKLPERNDPPPRLDPALTEAQRLDAAETILRAMSLTDGFARVVMLAGHGASVTNAPHESALQCGACGGHAGDVNARLLANLLNEATIRDGLKDRGIEIPQDTLFLAAVHDTTTDAVTLYDGDAETAAWKADLAKLRDWLDAAGRLTRTERAARLPRANSERAVMQRASDWAELRPEWGLAGCRAFIAAPRGRTEGTTLSGQSFLHSYDWRSDQGFGVLELIMTAPVVVASWISLQYYGSTVAPEQFGGGNKLLHNVVGGIGVLEGNGGALRPGLPWQSVHDGDGFQHDPLRLTVMIEAPREAMSEILSRHQAVRDLFDNRWLHLIALDDQGRMAWRYDGDLQWSSMQSSEGQAIAAE
ncbi:YbcC family protein [Lutimaribacter marinistellae]|uniref:Probable inorganic carbon transporter subunit DabA n=1 Tax=Lutimaribacter marinistellae TaxID=1820329 RepID=A0ABV7TG97_9RHOB